MIPSWEQLSNSKIAVDQVYVEFLTKDGRHQVGVAKMIDSGGGRREEGESRRVAVEGSEDRWHVSGNL